jgi:phosphoserine phosphatase RsbU/P
MSGANPSVAQSANPAGGTAWLVPISGPKLEPIELAVKTGGVAIGRDKRCDLGLPASADQVSRFHARFSNHDGAWHVADLESAWGTYVNGTRLPAGTEVPLREGDLLRITPWTFVLGNRPLGRGIQSLNDEGTTAVRTVSTQTAGTGSRGDEVLGLLLESAAAIHGATDEHQLAELVIDAACRGTGLQNAAMLRPTDAIGHFEVIASRGPGAAIGAAGALGSMGGTPMRPASPATGGIMTFSRSLLAAAASGNVAELQGGIASSGDISQSIVQMRISAALCVPLMLGGVPAAYLYLDSRGMGTQTLRAGASAYCSGLGRMASLALANLKRVEMERRGAMIEADLRAAKIAQAFILPQRVSQHGSLKLIGESRPGQFVGGDFFDVVPLGDGKVAVAVGDVSGKGIAASVLMTAAQGFLHARLLDQGELGAAITALNRYVCPRRPEGKFLTLWAGVFDTAAKTVTYVDAGHGYAMLSRGGAIERLDNSGSYPAGIEEGTEYVATTVAFEPGQSVMIVSDGIVEQTGLVVQADGGMERVEFGISGVQACISRAAEDAVADIFGAVVHHAGTNRLADDATAVWVRM